MHRSYKRGVPTLTRERGLWPTYTLPLLHRWAHNTHTQSIPSIMFWQGSSYVHNTNTTCTHDNWNSQQVHTSSYSADFLQSLTELNTLLPEGTLSIVTVVKTHLTDRVVVVVHIIRNAEEHICHYYANAWGYCPPVPERTGRGLHEGTICVLHSVPFW